VLFSAIPAAFAQQTVNPGPCNDPWISSAFKSMGWRANGSGTAGECAPSRYGGSTWGNYSNSQGVLNQWVSASRTCTDPWVGEAYTTAMGRAARGSGATGECNTALYGNWGSSFATLINNIRGYQQRIAAPAPQPSAPATVQVAISSFHIISAMGAKCLDVEGNNTAAGARIIAYNCQTSNFGPGSQFQVNQEFAFTPAGEIRTFVGGTVTMCMEDKGGLLRSMDSVDSWPCNGQQNQKWRFINGQIISVNGLCLNLRGGTQAWYIGNQDAILYACDAEPDEHFFAGVFAANGSAFNSIQPGNQATFTAHSPLPSLFVGHNGSAIVASGAGNIVSTNGSNIVASGAGNIVASGAGNIVVAGGQLVPVATSALFQ
jgi:endo-1,4-beta-xylanase